MSVFVDTSAFLALLDPTDRRHIQARATWTRLSERAEYLVTSNYVLVETLALAARRLGFGAVRAFQTNFAPILHPEWVNEVLHRRAVAALLTAGVRDLSLTDCVSFEIMRQLEISTAFAFDAHFAQQGFGSPA